MFRKTLFWMHLGSGVVVGLVVALMSFTGIALAFQPQVEGWLRAGLYELEVDAAAPRLPLEALRGMAEAARKQESATAITVPAAPNAAVAIHFGRAGVSYWHPNTGVQLEDPAAAWSGRFAALRDWHRWLGAQADGRALGRAITGACNFAFVFLIVSGLYLWFPRRWTRRTFAGVASFRRGLRGKARDFNWHHVIGFWSLPVLLVLAASGVVISYDWAHRLVFAVAGSEAPVGRPGPPRIEVKAPAGAAPLPLDALVERARLEAPLATELRATLAPPADEGVTAQHLSIREAGAFPPFASLSLSLDPHGGEVLHRMAFSEQDRGRRLRGWLRFLHTGEALGWPGQLVAAVASAGSLVLVWTGFALAWRRYAWWRRKSAVSGARIIRKAPAIEGPDASL